MSDDLLLVLLFRWRFRQLDRAGRRRDVTQKQQSTAHCWRSGAGSAEITS